jgi:hypothetical protein
LMMVRRPNDTVACNSKGTELNCSVNVAGTWTITVEDAAGTRTGDYAIAIQRLNSPVDCTAISHGAAPTAATIASPAEMDCYTFSGVPENEIRVRVAETSGTLVARNDLVRPDGTTVCAATTNTDLTCPLDATGTHTIFVADNAGSQTGDYAIAMRRLDSIGGCTLLTFGAAPFNATISAAAEIDCFRFSGAMGDQIRIEAGGAVVLQREVIRPDGTINCPGCQLDVTGTHKIVVGSFNGVATGDYKISIQRLNNPVGCTPIDFGAAPSSGEVGPGEIDCYTFSGSTGDRVLARLFKGHFQDILGAELVGPNGKFFCSTIADPLAADLACTLNAVGTHTIVVGSGDLPVSYHLAAQRLTNPVGCTALGFGDAPATGSIDVDAEMDCYTFGGAAGDQVRVRPVTTSGDLDLAVRVFGPDGQPADCGFSFGSDERTCQIDATGTYTLLAVDDPFLASGTGDYALAIQRLNGPAGCTPLSFGAAPMTGSIAAAAEIDCFTFSGSSGARVQIALPVTGGTLVRAADLFGPDGSSVCGVVTPCTLDQTGTYAILIEDETATETGDYAVAVQRLNNPPGGTCTALAFGAAPTNGTIGAPGEMDCYSFGGTLGARVRVRLVTTSGSLLASNEIARTDGTFACGQATALDVTCALDSDGQHRIIVSDAAFGPNTGSYAIAIQRLSGPNNCVPLAFGAAPVNGTIDAAAEMDCYSFNGTAGDMIRMHVFASGALVRHGEIARQNGTTLCSGLGSSSFEDDLTCRLDTTGPTRILIDDTSGLLTGAYAVSIQRLNRPVGCTALTFGAAPIAGTIATPGEVDCFTFAAAAGDRISLRSAATSGASFFVTNELLRPNGTFTCSSCVLESTGTFTVLISESGQAGSTGDYAVSVQRLNNPIGCAPIAFGAAPTAGTIAVPVETDCFTFTGAAGDRIHVDMVETSGTNLTANLLGPTGKAVCSVDPATFTCKLSTAGVHTILVFAGGTVTGNYSLSAQRANNPVGCIALGFGAPATTGTIAAAAEADCFSFNGSPGDQIHIRSIETSPTLTILRRVARPNGTLLNCFTITAPKITCTLVDGGPHTIFVGDQSGAGTGGYSIEIQRLNAPIGCTALSIGGAPLAGSIDAAAEFDCFSVSATAGATFTLDLNETSGTLTGQLDVRRPNGTQQFDCLPTTNTQLSCKADTTGTYTVLVGDAAQTQTGGYTITRST